MKKNNISNIIIIGILPIVSVLIYGIQFIMFHQANDTIFYFFQDLAFVPIQVVFVTIIINRFMNMIEARKKVKKINVIISTFFVEAGTSIMRAMSEFNRNNEEFCEIILKDEFTKKNSILIKKRVKEFRFDIYADPQKLEKLALKLNQYREFTLNMLGNDNLLEHDSFTDMLWAVFHVVDELQVRKNFDNLEKSEIEHLSFDIFRAYSAMVSEWINYMSYLYAEYPFLYKTAFEKAKL